MQIRFSGRAHEVSERPRQLGATVAFPLVLGAWAAAVIAGFGALGAYENRPGSQGEVPEIWPPGATDDCAGPRLLVFTHPRCPCTQATIEQLDRLLLAAGPHAVPTDVYLFRPDDVGDEFTRTSLAAAAARIPGVRLREDRGGRVSRLFGAATSGLVLFYDADGRLRFRGGITASRGHAGDNRAMDDLLASLRGGDAPCGESPVFGCSLLADESSR